MDVETKRGRFEVVDRGAGPVVVLLHGFPFTAESWSADAEALASRMRVVAPSMRGFGGSDATDLASLSIDTMADDVAAVLDALGLAERVVVGGLSMGGYVALAFARRFPSRLRGLVLADTRAEPGGDEARANRDKGITRIDDGDQAGFVEALFDSIVAPATRAGRPDVVAQLRRMAMSAPIGEGRASLRVIPEAGHMSNLEQPAAFRTALADFVASI
jgi:pimeloyl-ACP methyl ester carboxylesterase